jgi:hypothetical protein
MRRMLAPVRAECRRQIAGESEMSFFSERTVITLACVMAVGALIATPSLAVVATLSDKPAVSTAKPTGASGHRHHRPADWGWNQRRFRLRR